MSAYRRYIPAVSQDHVRQSEDRGGHRGWLHRDASFRRSAARMLLVSSLDEIERQIEEPTGEIDAMCLELVARAIDDENILRRLKIPEAFWPLISESWHRDEASLYGRLDLRFDGHGPAKLLEYNADTPTSIFEAAVFQWTWLEQTIERRIIPSHADQFNSIHERLIEAWKKLGEGRHLHLAGTTENIEDA